MDEISEKHADQEKIARIVAWMGGWPEHEYRHFVCYRCLKTITDIKGYLPHKSDDPAKDECRVFNPFTRIEDAFVVVERVLEANQLTVLNEGGWKATIGKKHFGFCGEGNTPARAIAEAAWQVIEKLKP